MKNRPVDQMEEASIPAYPKHDVFEDQQSGALELLHSLTRTVTEQDGGPGQTLNSVLAQLTTHPRLARATISLPEMEALTETPWILEHGETRPPGAGRCLSVPIAHRGRIIGALGVETGLDGPTDLAQDMRLLGVVSSLIADTVVRYRDARLGAIEIEPPAAGLSLRSMMDGYEREILTQVIRSCGGNQSAAARALKTTPRILSYRLRRHGLHAPFTRGRDH